MDEEQTGAAAFDRVIDTVIVDARSRLDARLDDASRGLDDEERAIVSAAAHQALTGNARRKLNRVLLLELHAAQLGGQLRAADERARFDEFVALACRPAFLEHLDTRYPVLRPRLQRTLDQQAEGLALIVRRLVADRPQLGGLIGAPEGALRALQLGEGDVHNRGQAVAQIVFEAGRVMYKPRPVEIDIALEGFLQRVLGDAPDRIRVPTSLARDGYGWSAFAAHRYCEGEAELATFYRGIGHWLAAMRLLGGTDLHHENIVAVGPVPVAVDVESLLAPEVAVAPGEVGAAVDAAMQLITTSVLRTGLVPFRAPMLGLHGVDISAAGALPGEQPKIRVPLLAGAGTDSARMALAEVDLPAARNHPCPHPDISQHWNHVVEGFADLTRRLQTLDRKDALRPLLAPFTGCVARRIRRPTQAYWEVMRMLWHPASLHDEPSALARARDILRRNAEVLPVAPGDASTIDAEVEDMRLGDIPVFSERLGAVDIDGVLRSWRGMRLEMEELTIRGALVTAYLNGRLADRQGAPRDIIAQSPHARDFDARRRALAAATVEKLLRLSVHGDDGTRAWISPVLGAEGWTMRTLQSDLYIGLGGIVVALAGYRHEMRLGRADPVEGLDAAIEGAARVTHALELREPIDAVGGFIGLGSQVLVWLTLYGLDGDPDMLARAQHSAAGIKARGFSTQGNLDLLEGVSGAIVPLLQLAEADGDERWLDLAAQAGRCLEATAIVDAEGARWPSAIFHHPLGGFAHGATGSGWALARLALSAAGTAADRTRWAALAEDAFVFEDGLYDAAAQDWVDVRKPGTGDFPDTWCHGSVGIGLAACDLYARTGERRHLDTLRRAVRAADRRGWGISHTLCHGDLSLWELLTRARALDPALQQEDPLSPGARIVSAMEEYDGAVGGLARDTYTPGLMSGVSGTVHFLNRLHPDCRLPSPLLLESLAVPSPRMLADVDAAKVGALA